MVARAMLIFAGLSLAASPALAQPSAQPLSLVNAPMARAAAPTHGRSDLAGGGFVPAIVALAIVAGGVLLAAGVFGDDDRNTGHPSSP